MSRHLFFGNMYDWTHLIWKLSFLLGGGEGCPGERVHIANRALFIYYSFSVKVRPSSFIGGVYYMLTYVVYHLPPQSVLHNICTNLLAAHMNHLQLHSCCSAGHSFLFLVAIVILRHTHTHTHTLRGRLFSPLSSITQFTTMYISSLPQSARVFLFFPLLLLLCCQGAVWGPPPIIGSVKKTCEIMSCT